MKEYGESKCYHLPCEECRFCKLYRLDPLYIFDLHDKKDEADWRRLIRVKNIEKIVQNLVYDIIRSLNFKRIRTAYFKSNKFRQAFIKVNYKYDPSTKRKIWHTIKNN